MNVFDNEAQCLKLEQVLKEWEGTPFVPYMSMKQVGCDCLQFAHAVYQEMGVARPIVWPKYSMQSARRQEFDKLCEFIESTGNVESMPITVTPRHGDMLVFSSGKVIHHTGIYARPGRIWHCAPKIGVTAAFWGDTTFTNHLERIYRPIL